MCVGTAGSQITVQFVASGTGVVELDNLDFEQDPSTTDPTNPTIFQDQYVNAWRTAFNTGGPGNGATLRYNVAPDGETLDSWILPTLSRQMVTTGINNYSYGNPDPALQDYLLLCHTLGADPYIILPITLSETDAKNLIDFLYGSSSTTYGAKRIALGGPTDGYQTWFRVLHMPLGNENWNSGFLGQALGWRSGTSSVYQDYTSRANTIFTDMRAVASFVASQTDLIIGVQQYGGGAYASNVATYGHPDSMEFADYNQLNVSDYSTNALLFTPAFAESYVSVNQTTAANPINQWSTAVAGLSLCGPSHTSQCKSTIYEEGNSTFGGTIPQANLNTFPNGGAYGVIMANQFLQDAVTAGTWTQNLFAATGYDNYLNSKNVAIWGVAVDYGGASSSTNSSIFGGNVTPRPVMLGLQLDNQAIIGPLIGCNISGTTAAAPYNLAANNNGVNAYNGVPTIYAYCFQSADNANDYAVELINESLTTSYPITFAGGGAPGTNVNVQQLAPKNPTDTNEATVGSWTGQTAAAVSITTLAGQDLSSGITLPPDSVTVLTYATAGADKPVDCHAIVQLDTWHLHDLAIGGHQRCHGGRDDLLHHQRHYPDHLLDAVRRSHHSKRHGNPGGDRGRHGLYEQRGGHGSLYHHTNNGHADLLARRRDLHVLADGDHHRCHTGRDDLLHNKRFDTDHVVNEVHRPHHGKPDGNHPGDG